MKTSADEWAWYASDNEEVYTVGPCETREQAVAEATESELGFMDDGDDGQRLVFYVAEARKKSLWLSRFMNVEYLVEEAEEKAVDEHGDEDGRPIFDLTQADYAEIECKIKAAVDCWQRFSGRTFQGWLFTEVRSREQVTVRLGRED